MSTTPTRRAALGPVAALVALPALAQGADEAGRTACAILAVIFLVVVAVFGVAVWLLVRWLRRRPAARTAAGTCPRCGQPSPPGTSPCPRCGLPLRAGSGSGGLIIALVVAGALGGVAFLGIVAALVIPNFLEALQAAKAKRTVVDLAAVSSALLAYHGEQGAFPPPGEPGELLALLEPRFGTGLAAVDGWKEPWRYECAPTPEGPCGTFRLTSGGHDRAPGGEGWAADIVVGPEGLLAGPPRVMENRGPG
jgi:general secretion pathway protein G